MTRGISDINKHLVIAVKVPGKVKNLDRAITKLGGLNHIRKTVAKVHSRCTKAREVLKVDRAERVKAENTKK